MIDTASSLQGELKQTRPFRSKAQEASIALLRTADRVRRSIARVFEPTGITFQQYNVLRILRGAHPEPLPTLEIRHRLIEEAPGITRLVDRLEELGLIARARCADDRRLVHCRITEEGLALLARLDPAVDAADDGSMKNLDADELQALIDALAVVRRSVG